MRKPLRLFALTAINPDSQFSRANRVNPWTSSGVTKMIQARSLKEAKEAAVEYSYLNDGWKVLVNDLGVNDRIVNTAPTFANGRDA
jgi:hypothetical protein